MAVTIGEIAKKAGVSPGTVSRVLNGRNKENRPAIARRSEMIRQIAKDLNYRPNQAARQMLRGRFDMMGFLSCGDLGFDWFARQLLHGVHEALKSQGSQLVITEIAGDKFSEHAYIPSFMHQSTVDGVLVHPGVVAKTAPVFTLFDGDPLPVVYVNHKMTAHSVHPADRDDTYGVTCRLIDAGHRAIGFWGPPDLGEKTHYSVGDRIEGFQAAMAHRGLSGHRIGYQHALISDPAAGCGSPEGAAFLRRHGEMTACVCYDLPQAVQMHVAAKQLGMNPPEDLCLVAFYERPLHTTTGIPMATSLIPFYEVGQEAVAMVNRIIADENGDGPEPSIAVRSSFFFDDGLIVAPSR